MPKTCIIIPLYNEENRFEKEKVVRFCNDNNELHFVLVNDGSKDGTLGILQELRNLLKNVEVIDLQPNRGKAEAIRCGVKHVTENGKFDYIAFLDADFSAPLSAIPFMLDSAKGQSIILGSRIMYLGANIVRNTFRHYVGRIFATMASEALNLPIYDTQCGAKIFSTEMAKVAFADPFATTWLFDLELIMRIINRYGWSWFKENAREVPLLEWIEKGGSKVKLSYMFKMPIDLWKVKRKYGKVKQ